MATAKALKDILQFYSDAGVDLALDEEPHDRFAEAKAQQAAKQAAASQGDLQTNPLAVSLAGSAQSDTSQPVVSRPATAPQPRADVPGALARPVEETIADARQQAAYADSLDSLQALVHGFDGCALKRTAKNTVFEDGNRAAKIMFVGEAPGRDEDRLGKPFVGRSGQLLDRILAAINLTREHVYIANIIPWRPPGNRTPTAEEMEICKPFIKRQIELMAPEILVFLGGSSAKNMLETTDGILKLRGKWRDFDVAGRNVPALPTLHPAYLLRQPAQKRLVWRDFLSLLERAESLGLMPDKETDAT